MFELLGIFATFGGICYVTWRWLLRPARDWVEVRVQEAELKPQLWEELEQIRRDEGGGPSGNRV